MTTTHQLFPRQVLRPPAWASPHRPGELPEPGERRRLREQWGLSTRQVALAFGVTPATVRSWECGRSTPRGGRREAYRRFLAGLAQHGAAGGPAVVPSGSARRGRRPEVRAPRRAGTPSAAVTALPRGGGRPDGASPRPAGPAGAGAPRVRRVGRGGTDPVSPARVRRLRLLGAAACVWSLAWWVILTCPPPV
ncbi:helix-turn-helix domain-containing protein [Streptomyces omiyaensis]|uniref:helix-turn-helix domain-containing protein n=1 Tax=Streptomyces omiyaensis TaxID=68247 RepID=UPI0036F567B7